MKLEKKERLVKEYLASAKDLLNTSLRMEDIFNYSTKKHSRAIAMEYVNDNGKIRHYRYYKYRKHAFEFASAIASLLYQQPKNRVIGLKVANCPRWCEIFWAILMAGYKPLLIDAKASKEGTANLLKQTNAIALITDDLYLYKDVNKFSVYDIVEENHQYSFTPEWENEVIFCSSGTTGDVKLMVYNGENLVHQITESLSMGDSTVDLMYPKKMGKLKNLAMVPLHHIFGFVAVFLWFTFYGKTLVFPVSNSSKDLLSLCAKAKVTHVFSVPLFWDGIATALERKKAMQDPKTQAIMDKMIGFNTGKIAKKDAGLGASKVARKKVQKKLLGTHVRYCISGGGYLNNNTATIINGIGYPLYNGFGMTEIGVTSVELSPNVDQRLKCAIGKPLNGVEYKIKEDPSSPGKGELLVKSKAIHIREIIGGKEGPTKLDEEGYFPTGDIAESDKTGRFYIRGRMKDVIINASGENIFPDELEMFFKNLDNVNKICIFGMKKENSTDEAVCLVLEVDNHITEEEIKGLKEKVKKIEEDLPHGVKIDAIYFARNKLPLANNMKVKRFQVKKAIEAGSNDYISLDGGQKVKVTRKIPQEVLDKYLEPVRQLFSEVLILPLFKIENDAHWVNDLGGDSMNYVELVQKIDEKFKITIPESKYGKLVNVFDFVEEISAIKDKKHKD